jgi:hypothetical protein
MVLIRCINGSNTPARRTLYFHNPRSGARAASDLRLCTFARAGYHAQ